MNKYIILVLVLLLVAYSTGILKKIPVIKDLPFIGDVELTDNCARKMCDGKFDLAISFENSDNRLFEKQKLELYYLLEIKRTGCKILGEGYKSGEQIIDTLTNKKIPKQYLADKFPVNVSGEIENDTLHLEISTQTSSNFDNKINVRVPFKHNTIDIVRGTFDESLTNGNGKAKLTSENN
jgi:hypothetical protein